MNLLVLEATDLHLGYLGCYGSEWVDMPALDRLAAEGIVFDQHFADRPDAPLRSSWTGRFALPALDGEPATAASLLPVLEAAGVKVYHITAAQADLSADSGLTAQWTAVLEAALATLETVSPEERWLVWVELPTLTPPWRMTEEELERWLPPGREPDAESPFWFDPPLGPVGPLEEDEQARVQNTFTAVVSRLDTLLAAFYEALAEGGWLEEASLWITARTGLPLGEHGVLGVSGSRLHEELVHLPLLVRLPNAEHAGRRVAGLTQPVDLAPTLLESFGVPVPADLHGRSLWPLLRGEVEQVRAFACTGLREEDRVEWSLRTADWAFLLPVQAREEGAADQPQLFQKPDDRWEVNNLLQHYPPWVEYLEQVLRTFAAAAALPGPLPPITLLELNAVLSQTEGAAQ